MQQQRFNEGTYYSRPVAMSTKIRAWTSLVLFIRIEEPQLAFGAKSAIQISSGNAGFRRIAYGAQMTEDGLPPALRLKDGFYGLPSSMIASAVMRRRAS